MSAVELDPVIEAALINAAAQIVASNASSLASRGEDLARLYDHDTSASEVVLVLERLRLAYTTQRR